MMITMDVSMYVHRCVHVNTNLWAIDNDYHVGQVWPVTLVCGENYNWSPDTYNNYKRRVKIVCMGYCNSTVACKFNLLDVWPGESCKMHMTSRSKL